MNWLFGGTVVACLLLLGIIFLIDADRSSLREEKVRLERDLTAMTASRERQQERADTCEARRDTEQIRCVAILDDFETRCQARVDEAADAACSIRETAYACPAFDENMCPRRERVGAGELRRATGARGPG